MRHDFVDRYSRIHSPIHRLPTSVKTIMVIGITFATVIIPYSFHLYFIAMFSLLILISIISTIPLKYLLGRLFMIEPFVLGISILSLMQERGGTIFLSIVLKSTICLFTMIIFSNTTPFTKILNLLKQLHISSLFVTILALMYRYLFVLIDEAERMQRARASRTFATNRLHLWKTRATLIGQLFIRSTERGERIYAAMRARGWK